MPFLTLRAFSLRSLWLLLLTAVGLSTQAQAPETLATRLKQAYEQADAKSLRQAFGVWAVKAEPALQKRFQTGLAIVKEAVALKGIETILRSSVKKLPGQSRARILELSWNFEALKNTDAFRQAYAAREAEEQNDSEDQYLQKCIVESTIRVIHRKVRVVISGTTTIIRTIVTRKGGNDEEEQNEENKEKEANEENKDQSADGLLLFSKSPSSMPLLLRTQNGTDWKIAASIVP
jgi:hypothetical protein